MASLKDLMVMGPARFLDTIYGTEFTGNSATATKWANKVSLKVGNSTKDLDGATNSITYSHSEIGATISSFNWTGNTTAGPTLNLSINGCTASTAQIPVASSSASGIITTGNQTFGGTKTFAGIVDNGNASVYSKHHYHKEYDSNRNVYVHFYDTSVNSTISSKANLRVWNGASSKFRLLYFDGDGNFTWDGNTILTTGNYTTHLDGRYVNATGDTMSGTLIIKPAGSGTEGGEMVLGAAQSATTRAGIVLDNYNSTFRIFGEESSDKTTKKGVGTPLVIDPYAKTITGGYTITGTLSGNASTATKLGTSDVGSSTKPIFLSGGTPMPFSSTIGDVSTPVYMNNGSITLCNTFKNRPYSYNKGEVYYYTWGGSQDLNWKKVFAASHATSGNTGEYIGCTVKGTIYHRLGNYNQAEVREYPFVMYMAFLSNGGLSDSCVLKTSTTCPTTIIRAVKVASNSFELQVRQPQDWQTMSIQFSVSGNSGNRSVFEPVNSSNSTVITTGYLQDSIPTRVVDAYNARETTFAYSQAGMTSTSWLASWNGYELRAISPSNVTAGKATALANACLLTVGNTGKNFSGNANVSWSLDEIGAIRSWSSVITCATWSRLCYVQAATDVIGSKFLLSIGATRNNVVYNDLFVITAHHSSKSRIVKISGSQYSTEYQLRVLANSNGDCYVELFDEIHGATSSTTMTVNCRIIPIYAGTLTKYTSFTSGATLPANFSVGQTMTVIKEADIQGTIEATTLSEVLSIDMGGTGASTPAAALGNLGGVSYTIVTNLNNLL